MLTRMFARVRPSSATRGTKHYTGFPPEISDDTDSRQLLAETAVVLVEQEQSGVFMYRYSEDGSFGGDTWHQTLDDAMYQAMYEFGDDSEDWTGLPQDVQEPIPYILQQIR